MSWEPLHTRRLAHSVTLLSFTSSKNWCPKWKQYLEAFGLEINELRFANEVFQRSNPFNSYLQQLSTGLDQYGHTLSNDVAFTAIANGGQMQVRLVDHLRSDTGKETPNPTTALGKVISPETEKLFSFTYEATRMKNGIAYDFNDGEKS